jgi:hypothetical protein
MLNQLDVGSYHEARASMTMAGGSLMLSKLLRIGESKGTAGKFVQAGGDIRALEICIAAANLGTGTDRGTTGEFEIRGGSLLTRHLTLGWGASSKAHLRVVGSKARPVIVLDYLWIGVRQKDMPGSEIDVDYEIDAGGVTPIVLWSKVASSVALVDDAARSTCRLHVSLLEAPPVGDIPLIRLPKPCRGTFTDLPEGSGVRAQLGKTVCEWTLTYHGGPEKSDIVLTEPRTIAPDGSRVAYTTGPRAKPLIVTREEVDSGLREMARREAALLKPWTRPRCAPFPAPRDMARAAVAGG